MNDDVSELQALKARWTRQAYELGVIEGRKLERQRIMELVDAAPIGEPARRLRRGSPPPPLPAIDKITPLVAGALRELEADNRDGVYPDHVAGFLKDNPPAGDGVEISVRQVRQALRQMTMTGRARRMARGKYLPLTVAEIAAE